MGISAVSICNMAISKFGAEPILALTEDSQNARACNRVYEQARDNLLRTHPWNFAVNRATLAMLSAAPAYGYDHAYQLPSNPYCLRVLELHEERDEGYDWHIEGRTLVTDADTARIKYIARITDPTWFDAGFVDVLVLRIAAETAIPITGEASIAKAMVSTYQDALAEAIGEDAIEGHADEDDKPIEAEGSWTSKR